MNRLVMTWLLPVLCSDVLRVYFLFLVAYEAPGASRHRDLLHKDRSLLCSLDGMFTFGRA
jgi:hypothetical protein